MAIQEKLLPLHSMVAITEILNQHTLWDRRDEFAYAAWNLSGRLNRAIFFEDESDELTEQNLIDLKELSRLIYIAYTDGIGYTVETTQELYQASGVMIALTELNNLLSLVEKMNNDS